MADVGGRRGRRASRVTIEPLPPMARFVFRGSHMAAGMASGAFGTELPTTALRSSIAGERAALWLGPDEWLLRAPPGEAEAIATAITAAVSEPHSLVEIGDRHMAFTVGGPAMRDVLAAGCPLDLEPEAFPLGMCTRTLMGKAEIVLWRQEADRFVLECGRSFGPYLLAFLAEAAREHGFGQEG